MSITRHHIEWLSLVPNSGPFLSLPVLAQTFPQGLNAHDADHTRRLRMAFEEWDENQLGPRPDPGIHRAWVKLVLAETLGFDELLAEGQEIPQTLKSDVAEYGETLRPDWIVNDPATKKARVLVQVYPRSQSLGKPVASSRWKTSPDTRMMQLLHDTGIRLGLVTNGDHWMLVNVPKDGTNGVASWYANLLLEEPITLRAFRSVLGADRLFSVPEAETLEALLDKSADDQQEVTDQLGYQVRRAVEVLIQALDKADQEHGRKLLAYVDEKILYESALNVMMRLVFLFCAEERELLLLGDDLYDKNYAVSTLREQLRVTADQFGEEILGLRYDAWNRLLTTFRAVFGGARHDCLKLPAYGGSLFDPDRFPFLEGREPGTSWKTTEATPLPVNNRTVLHLLEAQQMLEVKVPGGGIQARKLSFSELGIENIGHVYEGLLDHTAKRATEPVLGLLGTRNKEPEIALSALEKIAAKGEKDLLAFLKEESGRSESASKKGLTAELDDQLISRFRTACQDSDLWKRVKPFAGLVRLDTVGYPVVITTDSVFVTSGTDRRSSGTHYTPKSLTEPIVQYTLEPLVYVGPAEGLPKEQWRLRSAKELLALKICDMACGSGAFLVQACRYMATRLLEAWAAVQRANPGTVRITPDGELSEAHPSEQPIPDDPDERQTYALRIVAQRCLYGVDINPLAAEMAKLSLWLLTLAKDKPFEFLDHAIRCGDSLIGIHNVEQLRKFHLDGKGEDNSLFLQFLDPQINEAIALRRQITEMQANTVEEVEAQDRMLREATEKIDRLKCAADMLVGAEFLRWDQLELLQDELAEEERDDNDGENWQPSWVKAKKETAQFRRAARTKAAIEVAVHFQDSDLDTFRDECAMWLNGKTPFHWPLEFPEVMVDRGGFHAFVGNPPFMGGQKLTGNFGEPYRELLVHHLAAGLRGSADLCTYFFIRATQLLKGGGQLGFLATNTIAQGDTREVGLERLTSNGCVIPRAISSRVWPGGATVFFSVVWLRKGRWNGTFVLDDSQSSGITSFLTPPGTVQGSPHCLKANANKSFQGAIVLGMGFILQPADAQELLRKDARNKDVVFPFLNGEDLNSSPDQTPTRWIINFFDWSIEKAMEYPDCFRIIEETVKPERMQKNRKVYRDYWWQFAEKRPALSLAIDGLERVLVLSRITNHIQFSFVSSRQVFSDRLAIFPLADEPSFSVLASSFHYAWSWNYSVTNLSLLSYSPSDCFETFAFPNQLTSLASIGRSYQDYRNQTMRNRMEGLTQTYNRFHDETEFSDDIQKLRQLHVEMDNAVAAAYGWTGLELGHGFHKTKQGIRYTISEPARRVVLARLLELNHERYAQEVAQGLHDKKAKAKQTTNGPTGKPKVPDTRPSLFDGDDDVPESAGSVTDQSEAEELPPQARRAGTSDHGAVETATRPTPIDEIETDDIMAAFRQVTRGRGSLERDELLKDVSVNLGYRRLGPKIEEALRGHLRAAIRRRIIEADGATQVRAGTTTMADYDLEELRETFRSVMRKGTASEREDVIHLLARYLGFARVTDTSRDAIKSAINSAIRQGILGYEGTMIWRVE